MPDEPSPRTKRPWLGPALVGGFIAAAMVMGGILGSRSEPATDDGSHERFKLCEQIAKDNGLDMSSRSGQEAIGLCMARLDK